MSSGELSTQSGGAIAERPLTDRERLDAVKSRMVEALANRVIGAPNVELHNFTGDIREVWRMKAICKGPDVASGKDARDIVIDLTGWFIHAVQVNGPAGEIIDGTRTVLVDANGSCFGYVSDGVAKDLLSLLAEFGLNEINPPLPVKVVEVETRMGRRTLSLVPA